MSEQRLLPPQATVPSEPITTEAFLGRRRLDDAGARAALGVWCDDTWPEDDVRRRGAPAGGRPRLARPRLAVPAPVLG